ncbi:hypothetical protein NX801_11695 [Streptomyces sp. LP05-1]|uniref:Uncharacterized protein n=1 Tax=Streptomyces pyxinae TaxID=2970734 RepID=A0ABT2CFW1_9ACTN|nr:hypothetical protein [Streptomyces sp. LP05-1]MCS0636312.1 hypothetical protein [Streptomyces sp. LP05-1]
MTSVSRRAVLGYSGSAAAGAVLASGGAAEATQARTPEASAAGAGAAAGPAVEFAPGTAFEGQTSIGDIDAALQVSFTVRTDNTPARHAITERDIADALNELAVSRGWPAIQFYGSVRTPLN